MPLGAIAWAAVDPSASFIPEGLITRVRRNTRYPIEDYAKLASSYPVDPRAILRRLTAALDEAEAFVERMPSELVGVLFLEDGRPVQPCPTLLDRYMVQRPQRRGHWPTSSEIGHAMLERYTEDKR